MRTIIENDIIDTITEALEGEYYDDSYIELGAITFSKDYIVWHYNADRIINDYGVVNMLKKFVEYGEDDLIDYINDKRGMVNLLFHLVGNEIWNNIAGDLKYAKVTRETNKLLIKRLKEMAK